MQFNFKNMMFNIGILLACIVILSLWGFYSAIRPLKIFTPITPAHFGLAYKNIELHTDDNVTIRGWFIPNANPKAKAIIFLHGYPADKGNILPSHYFLHKKYSLLFIDFRYLGESGGNYSTIGKNEVLDVLAAIQYLRQQGIHDIGIYGFSLGGAVALMATERAPEVKAVIAESSYSSLDKMAQNYFRIPLLRYPLAELLRLWGWLFLGYDIKKISPVESAAQLKIPILIIHSKQDQIVPFEHALLFKKKLENKPNVEFLFYENLHHGEIPENHKNIIEKFFDKNL